MIDHVKITCNICDDLIPLIEDGMSSSDSKEAVQQHIAACPECARKYSQISYPSSIPQFDSEKDRRTLRKIQGHISVLTFFGIMFYLIMGALIVIIYTSKPALMLLLFPFIGGLMYWIGGRIWKLVPFTAALFWIFITLIADMGAIANWQAAVGDSIASSIMPFLLTYIGILIAALLKYAFKGEYK